MKRAAFEHVDIEGQLVACGVEGAVWASAGAAPQSRNATIMQPVRLFMVMSNSLLSLPKRMGQVDGLFEGIAGEVHSARYAGSADYSDKLRCSVVEGDSPKMLR
jgi:hypothetical protein